ncbi:protein of unknown function [Methylocaldum szegediense]|uniref:Uncharacterized protein n=1 Tax=Methylocaldum szegediense TaxID=73780 RepID=A0ABM9HYD1_9GAMM|nr:protein of unknown function [Methylocaldum szegediense]
MLSKTPSYTARSSACSVRCWPLRTSGRTMSLPPANRSRCYANDLPSCLAAGAPGTRFAVRRRATSTACREHATTYWLRHGYASRKMEALRGNLGDAGLATTSR